jgi:hypothetical protein
LHILRIETADKVGNLGVGEFKINVVYLFGGFLPPIKADGAGIYQQGRTLPVKFSITDKAGNLIPTATASLILLKVSGGVAGAEEIPISTSATNGGNGFRYNVSERQYVYNLSTDSLAPGTWLLKAALDDGKSYSVKISIKR